MAKVYGERSRCEVDLRGAALARDAGALVPEVVDRPHPRVAVWRWVPGVSGPPGTDALRTLARDLGRLAAVPASAAPVHWLDNVTLRAAALDRWEPDPDVRWLAEELRAVAASPIALAAPLVFQHGDLSMSNLVHDGHRLHLVDFETIRAAPREWDLATLGVSVQRYGALQPAAMGTLLGAYGAYDEGVLSCCGRAKELLNASWLYLMREQAPALVGEARRRVASLRDGRPHRWRDLDVLSGAQRVAATTRATTSVVEKASSEV